MLAIAVILISIVVISLFMVSLVLVAVGLFIVSFICCCVQLFSDYIMLLCGLIYVTGSGKTAHFAYKLVFSTSVFSLPNLIKFLISIFFWANLVSPNFGLTPNLKDWKPL